MLGFVRQHALTAQEVAAAADASGSDAEWWAAAGPELALFVGPARFPLASRVGSAAGLGPGRRVLADAGRPVRAGARPGRPLGADRGACGAVEALGQLARVAVPSAKRRPSGRPRRAGPSRTRRRRTMWSAVRAAAVAIISVSGRWRGSSRCVVNSSHEYGRQRHSRLLRVAARQTDRRRDRVSRPAGRVLLVQPTYKPTWEVPGGSVEAGESPAAAAAREVAVELGVALPHHDPPQARVADLGEPGGGEEAAAAGVDLIPGDLLSGLRDLSDIPPAHAPRSRAKFTRLPRPIRASGSRP